MSGVLVEVKIQDVLRELSANPSFLRRFSTGDEAQQDSVIDDVVVRLGGAPGSFPAEKRAIVRSDDVRTIRRALADEDPDGDDTDLHVCGPDDPDEPRPEPEPEPPEPDG